MARDSMVFFRSTADALAELDCETYKTVMQSIFSFAYDGVEPEFDSPVCRMAWKLIRPQVAACVRKYEAQANNGKKGGRPKKTQINPTKTQINPTETQENPSETLNVKCKMLNAFNDECITTRARVREDSDIGDEFITTTDGRRIPLKELKFGGTKIGGA